MSPFVYAGSRFLHLLIKFIRILHLGRYYGHPNRKRGETDPRQCIWHSANDPSDDDYTAAIVVSTSSIVGICEFQTNHFVCAYQIVSMSCWFDLVLISKLIGSCLYRTVSCAEI